ncbi:hypothetical protein [Ferrimonas pelagia]|uniref:WD domain-containing protein, G-beta repeat-containing protein n=1 Tax=Ferrimonas pelagia TaxID=1177826 RepID=A0ABP9FM87_9GAMM
MSENRQFKTLTDKELSKGTVREAKLNRKYRIEWGPKSHFSIVCDDEDSRKSYQRHSNDLIGLLALKKCPQTFVTIGLDHNISVSAFNGRQLQLLTGHTDRILGVLELSKSKLLSVAQDKTVRIWDLNNGEALAVMTADVVDLSAIKRFANSEHLAIREPKGISIWTESGQKIADMQGLKSALNAVYTLFNDSWLVETEQKLPSIWSATGSLLYQFEFDFSFENDLIELGEDRLLIRNNGAIGLWDLEGKLLCEHEASEELEQLFDTLKQGRSDSTKKMKSCPDVIDYPHLRNPLDPRRFQCDARQELKSQKLALKGDRKLFWDFFNRPLFEPIKTAMKEIVSSARRRLKQLETLQAQAESERDASIVKRLRAARWSCVALAIALPLAGAGYLAYLGNSAVIRLADLFVGRGHLELGLAEDEWSLLVAVLFGTVAASTALVSLIMLSRNRIHCSRQLQLEHNIEVYQAIAPAFESLILQIKQYRRRLLSQIPIFSDKTLFDGKRVAQAIDRKIDTDLKLMAMDECGLEKEDIIYTDHEAIVLKDWALIQDDEKRQQVESKLHLGNARSFWSGANRPILFAVQYVQYIFLTEDKVDVFTTYYDFIAGKCIGKEANAFYYKDVTNIAKREVDRGNIYGNEDNSLSATEIALSVASGEKIRLTILNEEGVSSMANAAKDNESMSAQIRIDQLKQDRESIVEDPDLDEDERSEELALIDAQIIDITNQEVAQDVSASNNMADETIRNIRSQLRNHKQLERVAEAVE